MEDVQENQPELASRWSRIGAAIIDSLILGLVMIPLAFFTGGFDGISQKPPVEAPMTYQLLMAALGFGLYCVVNWKFLSESGQTVGKKILKIKVVYTDCSQATVQDLVFKRYALMLLISYTPWIGGFITMVNVLMIFGKQKRALHDRIANTKVIVS
ncbi:RDD family protein [Photobacterium swingsii]|uniref:RDD family protein n=1 Tax=Photobacterium swingsii TaxID=680026 RepID=UPI003D113202